MGLMTIAQAQITSQKRLVVHDSVQLRSKL